MQKAILIGNGFSSQLIPKYTDDALVQSISDDSILQPIYKRYCTLFSAFDRCKSRMDTIKKLEELHFSNVSQVYDTYFDKYQLSNYTGQTGIRGIETLLKVGQLFREIRETGFDEDKAIRTFAATYYWNHGLNGIAGIENSKFSATRFKEFLNAYGYVYTTNYDTILDDVYSGVVAHLHGSFLIDKDGCVRNGKVNIADSLIVWGKDDAEKMQQIDEVSGMHKLNRGFRFNISKLNTVSALDGYFSSLRNGLFSELDIIGFSGENDKHINEELVKNSTLEQINFYCAPSKAHDQIFHQKVSGMFDDKFSVKLICWDNFWNCFMREGTNHAQPTT